MVPPNRPYGWRNWGYYDRPRRGCGCLYALVVLLLLWLVLSLFIPWLAFWS